MPASQTLQNTNLDHAFNKAAWVSPTTIQVALLEAAPTATTPWASLVKASYTGYLDQDTVGTDWNSAGLGQLDNANAITFPQSTGGSSTVTHFAVRFGNTGENYVWGAVDVTRTVSPGDTPEFQAGSLQADVT